MIFIRITPDTQLALNKYDKYYYYYIFHFNKYVVITPTHVLVPGSSYLLKKNSVLHNGQVSNHFPTYTKVKLYYIFKIPHQIQPHWSTKK